MSNWDSYDDTCGNKECNALKTNNSALKSEGERLKVELKEAEAAAAVMRGVLRELKIRIAYIGMPQEPFWLTDVKVKFEAVRCGCSWDVPWKGHTSSLKRKRCKRKTRHPSQLFHQHRPTIKPDHYP